MATIKFADIYDPVRFDSLAQESQIEKNAFIQSGVQVADSTLSSMAKAGSTIGETDNIAPLSMGEPDYPNDDPAAKLATDKIGTRQMKYRKAIRAKGWSGMDLARALAYQDPMQGITSRTGHFWATDNQNRLIKSAVGIMEDSITSHNGDLVVNVAKDTTGAVQDAEKASALNFLKALELKGDAFGQISALAVHSAVYFGLYAMNLISTIRQSEDSSFETFQGKRIIIDDSLPSVKGTNRIKYTSIFFGAGAFRAGEGLPEIMKPSEYTRDPKAGNGSGEESLITRRGDIVVPVGYSFNSSVVAGKFATYAELANKANWDRVWDAKNIPISFLITNG